MTSEPVDRRDVEETVRRLVEEVTEWTHVAVAEHRSGGTEFQVAPREIGHVHPWGLLDVAYPRALRDVLVEEGHTGAHHVLSESGWTTFYVEGSHEYEHARRLLRLAYLYHVTVLKGTPAGAEEFADVDVRGELDAMGLSRRIRSAFDHR
ncbi:MAG TPA: luciferase family protein [Natrialbaceae archaeon]|nr:luciferase family protein [Natrialbaceae archaeon]